MLMHLLNIIETENHILTLLCCIYNNNYNAVILKKTKIKIHCAEANTNDNKNFFDLSWRCDTYGPWLWRFLCEIYIAYLFPWKKQIFSAVTYLCLIQLFQNHHKTVLLSSNILLFYEYCSTLLNFTWCNCCTKT